MSELATKPTTKEIRSLVTSDAVQAQLAIALPRYYSPEQFSLIVRTAINRNPKLAECDQGSFLAAMMTAASMGILPNGRDGHLIPRWNGKTQRTECTFQPDYKGIVGLIRRNDQVADVYAVNVHKNDTFKITQGLHRDIIHEPDYTRDRGEIIGVYAVILFKSGLSTWEFLPRAEVEAIRARSDSWKAHVSKGYDTPWKTDEGEMFKKTALKRVSKLADLSPDTMDRIHADPDIQLEKPADAAEIKRAQVPAAPVSVNIETPALPEPEPEPQAEPEPEAQPVETIVEPAPAAKPARKQTLRKPAPEPEPEPAPQAEPEAPADEPAEKKPEKDPTPNRTECIARLKKAGFTWDQMDKFLTAEFNNTDRDEETLGKVLGDWEELINGLKATAK